MFENFWTYQLNLPPNVGYELFGKVHLCILAIATVLGGIYVYLFVRAGHSIDPVKSAPTKRGRAERDRAIKILGTLSIILILARIVYVVVMGESLLYELPLHLCSLAGIMCFVYSLTKIDFLGRTLYSVCAPGALLAMVFPNGNMYPPISFITIQSYLFHLIIILFVISILLDGRIRPSLRSTPATIIFVALLSACVYIFDRIFNVNYMFLNGTDGILPLEYLAKYMGNPGYLIGYFGSMVICIILMNIKSPRK